MTVLSAAMNDALQEQTSWQEALLKDFHRHPELSMREERTRDVIAAQLIKYGYEVHEIGGGVVGVLAGSKGGEGRTVLFRADIDGLPVQEASGLDYASTETQADGDGVEQPTMHACGHDFHITAGLGAAQLLAEHREDWSGTYIALFQPGEEKAAGARSMVAGGVVDAIPTPDVCLGQHVLTDPVAGRVAVTSGPVMSTAASARIVVHGAGSHGSMPHLGVDPVVLASAIVTRIQTLVARELSPADFGVVTVGSLQAGASANIIPDSATMLLNFRAYDEDILERLIEGARRMVRAECEAARSPHEPEIEIYDRYPLTTNDEAAADVVRDGFLAQFGQERVEEMSPVTASEDFSIVPDAFGAPYCYWGVGAYAERRETYPNHSPLWSPDLQPTLGVATEAAVTGALAHLRA
ncbi:amidohydrolase [Brachybacterium fresconis]|uniref:Hippurate hydrolase n=1 Tax=Brachybacterium fresconis TaxID=173363 RepID=A0ABS4YLS4_9MICO|nr:amidohydrolase [Brachybacterium fresconis]MBP2409746.1 hippurate hydrolase [Brachybacterium fresconis]